MTDPTPPESNEPPKGPEPLGLVEELRHEIEEVVEHVPEKVRWTVRKLVLISIAGVVGLIVLAIVSVALYYANRTELVAHELTLFLNHTLDTRSNVRIEFSDIRGNPFQRLRLVQPRVVFRDSGRPLLEAPWIEIGYSPMSLLKRDGKTVDVAVESPAIHFERGADGALLLPTWKTAGSAGSARTVDMKFRLHQGTVDLPIQEGRIEGLDIDASLATGVASRAVIRSMKWRKGPFDSRQLEFTGEVSAGDSVQVHVARLTTAGFALSGDGGWRKGEKAKWVHAAVSRLSWKYLAGISGNNTFDVPGNAVATIDARGDSIWHGQFRAQVNWNGLDAAGNGAFEWKGQRMSVESLAAQSKAGDLKGHFSWSRLGWDVGGDVSGGQPSLWDAIGIPGWPAGKLNGRFEYAVSTRNRISNGTLTAQLTPSELAGWRADSTTVTADLPSRGTRVFDVHSLRRGGHFELHGETLEHGWDGTYKVAALPLDEWPDGRASGIRGLLDAGEGTVHVTDGKMSVTGNLMGRGTDWLGLHTARWKLSDVNGLLLPAPDLVARAGIEDVMFLGLHFDSAASPIHLGDRNLDLQSMTAQAGDTLLAFAGRADWNAAAWQLEMSRAQLTSQQFHWTADPPVQFVGDPQGVTFRRLVAHDGDASMQISGRWGGPGGRYDWRAEALRLDLARLGLPVEWGLKGTSDATLRVEGVYGDPRWTFEGRASQPAFGGHHGDSLDLALTGAMSRVGIDRMKFMIGGGELAAHGRVERMTRAWPDSLTGTAVQRWLLTSAAWSGGIDANGFPIERVTGLFPASNGWAGRLEGHVAVGGNPARPELDVKAVVKPLTWHDFNMEKIEAEGKYADERLAVTRLKATRLQLESTAEGTIPIRIAFDRPWVLLDKPMDATLHVRQGDLRLLPRLVPQLAAASGSLEADATIHGTPLKPDLDGRGRISGGSLRLAGRDELLDHMSGSFRLNQSTLTLDSLTAREGEAGRLRASGSVKLDRLVPSGYHIDLVLSDFTASDPGLYAVQFDGNFQVTDGPRVRGQWLPLVTGSAVINRAVVLIDFANQSESAQLASSNPPLYWVYRIDLSAKSNLHWQPPDGDIEFSADLTAEQTPTELRLFGEMQSLRGTYYFLSNRFTVNNATLTFDNVSGLNPTLDASATTRVVPLATAADISANASKPVAHEVTVTITGRSREPVIAFESSPSDWDENEILRELTVLRFVKGGVAQGDPFDNYLTRALNRTLSAEMSRAFKGYVSDWTFERDQGGLARGEGEVTVSAASQVTRNLLLRYSQRVPGLGRDVIAAPTVGTTPFERDFQAEYRLNRLFLISSELRQRRSLTGTGANPSSAPDFNVDLKARWEY